MRLPCPGPGVDTGRDIAIFPDEEVDSTAKASPLDITLKQISHTRSHGPGDKDKEGKRPLFQLNSDGPKVVFQVSRSYLSWNVTRCHAL